MGRKQNLRNEEWLDMVHRVDGLVSRADLDALSDTTIRAIREMSGGKNAAYAWSGGKDSIVLGDLCRKAGIDACMIGVCDLEYPAFRAWIDQNKPASCEVVNTHQDLDWLAKHPAMLFPQSAATASRWFSIVQHRAQRLYFKAHHLDLLLLGRRRADGNYVGRGANLYTDGSGVQRFSPLADWTHEQILRYIRVHKLPLPPLYGWKNGYLCGTHPWPARPRTGSVENGWREVYEIDPSIVHDAARLIDSAKAFLEEVRAQ